MTLYSLVLFIHVSTVLVLAAVMSLETLFLYRLRRASTVSEALAWIEPVPGLPLAAPIAGLITVLSGIYLTLRMAAFDLAWPKVALAATLLLLPPLGALSGRRMGEIRRACAGAHVFNRELLSRLQDPLLKMSLGLRISITFALVLLMGTKPDLWVSLSIIGTSALLGAVPSLLRLRRGVPFIPGAEIGCVAESEEK